jgi:hypothetical protein
MLRQETFDNNGRWFAEPECGIAAAWLGLYVMILGTVLVPTSKPSRRQLNSLRSISGWMA